jgi:sulfite reductase alpha subunit-like flavoprotein
MARLVRELVVVRGGHVYVAGGAGAMPREVCEAIREAVGSADGGEGMDEREADEAMRALETAGRYQVEVWG